MCPGPEQRWLTPARATILGAFIVVSGGIITTVVSNSASSEPTPGTTSSTPIPPTAIPTPTVNPTPNTPTSTENPAFTTPNVPGQQQAPVPAPPPIAVTPLSPVDGSGYTRRWQDQLTVGAAGVVFQSSGPVPGTGSRYSIQYQSQVWDSAAGVFDIWTGGSSPTPGECAGGHPSLETARGTTPRVGERYCFITFDDNVLVYMQVTGVGASEVTLAGWLWNKQGSG